jgi:hypothetical protein
MILEHGRGAEAVPEHHQQPQDLAKLIRKLRWIGMDEEACRLQTAVATLPADARGAVFAESLGTD